MLLALWSSYLLRIRSLQHRFEVVLEARVTERTRIARDLHDTLLQSFHGLLFRFQAARNMLPRRPEEAMNALDTAITRTEQAISESRDAIKDLRVVPAQMDIAERLAVTGREWADSRDTNANLPIVSVTVEGEQKQLAPMIQDEIFRIAHEVLLNAFRHSSAHRIESEVRYDHHFLRLRIRDDGQGIDPEILKVGGRPGHWGLAGIRERALRIGAQLDFWSQAGAGTEVQITVPAAIAYKKSPDGSRFVRWWRSRGQRS